MGVELSRESVGTMWEAAETQVKGDGGSDRQIEETFLEMISKLVNTGTSIQLQVNYTGFHPVGGTGGKLPP